MRSFDFAQPCPAGASSLLNDGANHTINQGTSMAAPHVTGTTALLMQRFGALTPAQVKSYLNSHATTDANTGLVWNQDWGNGKLNVGDLAEPIVNVTAPNGGENILTCGSYNITWTASDAGSGVANVDLQLSRSGAGGPFENIALAIPNSGSYSWSVSGPATANAFVKVTAHDNASIAGSDLSDAAFTIADPVIVSSAGAGGSISPLGNTSVACGGSQTYTISTDACHTIADVLVDGGSVGAVTSYTFTNVVANHTISASFTQLPVQNLTTGVCYNTIQAAVDDVPPAPAAVKGASLNAGPIIHVSPGTYTEQVVIPTNLVLEGEGCGVTIIKSPAVLAASFNTGQDNKPVVFVNGASDVTIRKLTVDGDGKGDANHRFIGIAYWNGGGQVSEVCVERVRDATFSGNQDGNAVYAFNNTGGPIRSSSIACRRPTSRRPASRSTAPASRSTCTTASWSGRATTR